MVPTIPASSKKNTEEATITVPIGDDIMQTLDVSIWYGSLSAHARRHLFICMGLVNAWHEEQLNTWW